MQFLIKDEAFPTIGAAARQLGVAVQTLRLYENSGLILPARTSSGRRLYSIKDMERLRCIRDLITKERLNINGIRKMLSLIPCWEYRGGIDEDCLGCQDYREAIGPCWNVRDVEKKCRDADCRSCGAYHVYMSCKNIKNILINSRSTDQSKIKPNIVD